MSKTDLLLNTLWPVGTQVVFCDAWGKNPRRAKVIRHYGLTDILVEDSFEIRSFGPTWRIASKPPPRIADFYDLLGDQPAPSSQFEDLLG